MRTIERWFMTVVVMIFASILWVKADAAEGAKVLESPDQVRTAFAQKRPTVIMFHAEWCGACKLAMPNYLKAAQELAGKVDFYVWDIDNHMGLRSASDKKKALLIEAVPMFVA